MYKAFVKDDFKNLLEYQNWVNYRFQNLSNRNKDHLESYSEEMVKYRISKIPEWYGEGTTYEELRKGISEYKKPALIEKMLNEVSDKITTGVRDKIKARKINYNPNGLGIFVFDRAAMGMYRLKEFFSPSRQQVVDAAQVKRVNTGFILIEDGTPVQERFEQKPDGKPKIRTSSKNVYAYFPPVSKEKQAVELFISCGGHAGIKAEQFLYSGINAIVFAQLLEKARIQTRISIVTGSSPDNFKSVVYAAVIPVKNYDEVLDINLVALLTSDPRFFRYEGFKGLVALYDHFNVECPDNLGYGMNKERLIKTIEESSYTQQAKLAPNRFYFGWTFNETDVIKNITEAINELSSKLNVT